MDFVCLHVPMNKIKRTQNQAQEKMIHSRHLVHMLYAEESVAGPCERCGLPSGKPALQCVIAGASLGTIPFSHFLYGRTALGENGTWSTAEATVTAGICSRMGPLCWLPTSINPVYHLKNKVFLILGYGK